MFELTEYKDHQYTATVNSKADLNVKIRGNTYAELFKAATIKEAWDNQHKLEKNYTSTLEIMCLISQRSDRRFSDNASFDLKVVANFINSLNFDCVKVLHPHSSVALALINNSEEIAHFEFVEKAFYELDKPTLISPDAGAYKTCHGIAQKLNATLIPANKVRVDGNPSLIIQGDVTEKNCLIVDDLADGGRTFYFLAQKLKELGASKVSLYVTHGLFSNGYEQLSEVLDGIYCTNSFKVHNHKLITQFKVI